MNQSQLLPLHTYSEEFERVWAAYPVRPGNPKRAAYNCYQRRISEGHSRQDILSGVERYARYCDATQATGKPFVMMARTFFGPDLHFLEEWESPDVLPEWAILPKENNELCNHAKKHGLPEPGRGINYRDYRAKLQNFINARLEEGA